MAKVKIVQSVKIIVYLYLQWNLKTCVKTSQILQRAQLPDGDFFTFGKKV
jgi:hypothetical protein